MTADAALLDLDTLYMEVDPHQQARAWQQSRSLATAASRWRAYLNQLGLNTLTTWLKAEGIAAKPAIAKPLLSTVWELVTGSALICQGARLIVLATEAVDDDELSVPQSWVDIPSWAGDYYLLLQVNPDDGWVRFSGFATHQTLKEKGDYNWRDRTYSLDSAHLTDDLNVLLVAQDLYPEAIKRTALAPLPTLSTAQARQLIARLGTNSLLEPRLAVGFEPWGALVANGGWRRQLAEQRWGRTQPSVRQWLQSGLAQVGDRLIPQIAEQLGWQQMSYQTAAAARDAEAVSAQAVLCREIEIEDEAYTLQVMPLLAGDNAWRFELTKMAGQIPLGVSLELLSEDLQPFAENQAIATAPVDALYVDVALAPDEGIVWKTEPAPSQYEPEILRF